MILHSGTPSTSSSAPTSHSQESPVPSLVGQCGPSYQPNIYHPPIYTQYYNQGIPYTGTYSIPTIPQPSSPSPMGAASVVPVAPPVMTTLKKVLDFVYFLPFLFSLYHCPEPSGMFYDDPCTSAMMRTLDHSSMT